MDISGITHDLLIYFCTILLVILCHMSRAIKYVIIIILVSEPLIFEITITQFCYVTKQK